MRLILAASLVLIPAYAASAQAPNDGGTAGASKKICKIDPEDTGSKIRRRICKTEAEWNRKTDDGDSSKEGASKRSE